MLKTVGLLLQQKKTIPIVVPGWEDSTYRQYFCKHIVSKNELQASTVKSGIEYMTFGLQ
jgi:deoxyhypusine synthase